MTAAILDVPARHLRPGRGRVLPSLHLRDAARPAGRPAGEVRAALLDAIDRLATPDQSPTLLELAAAAQVGRLAAERTILNMHRAGHVRIVRRRWVAYRRSPVAEWARAVPAVVDAAPAAYLARCMTVFAR